MWTIDEFNDAGWYDLREFCEENDVYPDDVDLDRLVDSYYVSDKVKDLADNYSWDTITDYLRDITWDGDNGEVFEDGDCLRELTEEVLSGCKDEVLERLHQSGVYLEGEEGYVEDDDDNDEDEDEAEDTPCTPAYAGCFRTGLYGLIKADPAPTGNTNMEFEEAEFERILGGDG